MTDPTIRFEATEDGVKLLAAFLAQLVREGVTYKVDDAASHFTVTLTGGH